MTFLYLIRMQVIPVGSIFAYLQCDWQAEQAGKVSSRLLTMMMRRHCNDS